MRALICPRSATGFATDGHRQHRFRRNGSGRSSGELGRFPLFFPERRDFFLDDLISMIWGINRDPLPFTAGGLIDASGNRQDVDLGVKATGRLGQYRLGFLNTKMNGSGEIDGENLGVLRLVRMFCVSTAGSS